MTRVIRAAVVVALLVSIAASPAVASPFQFPRLVIEGYGGPEPPPVGATSWILYDHSSGSVLAENNADEIRAPASITKILTVLVALENNDQSEMVTISRGAADTGEREIGLVAGESVTLGALLRAAMIHSANDAATAIAEHVGGSVDGFSEMMNARAAELGMTRSHFMNPHGLDAPGHITSARDMLRLAQAAMARQDFRDISRSRMVLFPDAPDGTRRIGTSTNLMLSEYEGNNGIKTGFTSRALLTFVASAERSGRELYAVVLGTEGRRTHFDDARTLFDYGFETLNVYGTLAGLPYDARRLTMSPDPLTLAADIETQVHLAGEGLLAVIPRPPQDLPELPPPPVETTRRYADATAHNVWQAVVFWITTALGS
jgi:serine-type D-Ala-D-Ala carboxypeptidase (penicillin-binding protein 5/6)